MGKHKPFFNTYIWHDLRYFCPEETLTVSFKIKGHYFTFNSTGNIRQMANLSPGDSGRGVMENTFHLPNTQHSFLVSSGHKVSINEVQKFVKGAIRLPIIFCRLNGLLEGKNQAKATD